MHIGIIVPLKSKKISKDWDVTCDSLYNTLSSITNQTSQSFTILIVGHEKPPLLSKIFPNIQFHSVTFPPPDRSAENFCHMHLVNDKNLKIVTGMSLLKRRTHIDYWYQIDADDLVHKDFILNLQIIDGQAGAVLEGGYLLFKKCNRVVPSSEMSALCGSTSIISSKIVEVPEEVNIESMRKVPWAKIPHKDMKKFFSTHHPESHTVFRLPLLCYVLASGDNISDKWRSNIASKISHFLKPYLLGKKLTKTFRSNFGFDKNNFSNSNSNRIYDAK